MGSLSVGTIVFISFPYADLKGRKKRPALVVAHSSLNTVILCQITSRQLANVPGIPITEDDFESGGLPFISYLRPDKLFTVDTATAAQQQLGVLRDAKVIEIKATIRKLFL